MLIKLLLFLATIGCGLILHFRVKRLEKLIGQLQIAESDKEQLSLNAFYAGLCGGFFCLIGTLFATAVTYW